MCEGLMIELEPNFTERQPWPPIIIRAAEAHIFSDDASIPGQAQARELKIDTACPEFLEQRLLHKPRQIHLVHVEQSAQQSQDHQPNHDSEAAKIDPASTPETALGAGGHVRAKSEVR